MPSCHLAQINIGRLIAPLDDPRMADFVAQLAVINALADRSPGFVWRLQSDSGNAMDIPYSDDPRMAVNMSVWESLEALRDFTYASAHLPVFKQRRAWFEKLELPHYCLWWAPAGHIPTVVEGTERLESYRRLGSTPFSFWFSEPYPPDPQTPRPTIADPAARP
jgi:hypothetical protein